MKYCKFCQIIRGELPSSCVFEDALVYALLDVNPINPGHTLVMPRRHVCAFTDLNAQEVAQLALIGQRVASVLKANFPYCEGISLSLADGKAAGQEVLHTHLHVIPRRTGDGFGWRRYGSGQDRSELDVLATRIRSVLDINTETN